MKKGIFFISLSLLIFISCENGIGNKCADCTTTFTTTVTGGYTDVSKTTTELCGKDLKEADGKTTVTTSTSGGVTARCVAKTNCVDK
jgi:hypothetical protein